MGWFDILAPKRTIASGYYLMQGESGSPDDLYLFQGSGSGSIAGRIHKIGWNSRYILFTDDNWPKPWNLIDVRSGRRLWIPENKRVGDSDFKTIAILSSSDAWLQAKH